MRLEVRGEYPPDWREIAERVKTAAKWRCVRCGHPFRPGGVMQPCDDACDRSRCAHARFGKALNFGVHHLDGDKGNCRWWNLLATDNACHLSIQARVIPTQVWLFEHSDWFLPYVCGWYAWYYGGVEISREQAIADPQRWIQLGQPWRFGRLYG